jgi:nifR3 family TIM-barrel protein
MNYWYEKIKIGNREYPRFIGGPLDGITDSPFRKLVREFSQEELLYSEMRHVGTIINEKGGHKALNFEQLERPLNFQVAANKIEFIEKACEKILAAGVECIDLNVGCPAKNVVCSGSGSALMADIPKLKEIVLTFKKSVNIPFTVKIRAGFKTQNAIEVAKMLEDCGVDALSIHPRLQTQKFEGRPDYALVEQVKKAVKIPVIVSGGIVNWATAKMVYESTGVDGFLIARGMWAKPWKLLELKEHSQGRPFTIDNMMILKCALKHLDYMITYYGPHGLYNFRKHLPFYIKGLPSAAIMRERLVVSQSVDDVKLGLEDFLGKSGA